MSMMKSNLTTIPMCPRERFALYKSSSRLVLCYKKDLATLLHLVYYCYLLPIMNYLITQVFIYLLPITIYLITKLSFTDNFSACREYLTEKLLIISFCSSLGSTLLLIEKATIDPLHLWVIKTLFWRRCRGEKRLW